MKTPWEQVEEEFIAACVAAELLCMAVVNAVGSAAELLDAFETRSLEFLLLLVEYPEVDLRARYSERYRRLCLHTSGRLQPYAPDVSETLRWICPPLH